jgi:hypothetical protein
MRNKIVPQLVEKYKTKYPGLDRDLLRKLIRLENPGLFLKNPSNLKKLDRYLRKAFEHQSSKQPLPKASDDLLEKTLLKIRRKQHTTTFEEVASNIGIPPSNIETSIYKLVQKHGWETSKTKLGDIEIDFKKPFNPETCRFGGQTMLPLRLVGRGIE